MMIIRFTISGVISALSVLCALLFAPHGYADAATDVRNQALRFLQPNTLAGTASRRSPAATSDNKSNPADATQQALAFLQPQTSAPSTLPDTGSLIALSKVWPDAQQQAQVFLQPAVRAEITPGRGQDFVIETRRTASDSR